MDLMEKAERATVRVDAASSSWSSSSENVEKRSVDFVLDGFKGRSETDECHATLIASNTSETVSKCKTMLLEPIDNVTSSYSSSS